MPIIHPTAVIDAAATLGDGCTVGPFCVVGPDVTVGAGSELHAHAVLTGRVEIGERALIGSFAVLGGAPQDRSHVGEPGQVLIGADVAIREHVTVHAGSSRGGMVTRVGDRCVLMVGSHVGHDGVVGDDCTLVNGVMLGGHVQLDDGVFIGGGAQVHQFVRIGRHAHIGGGASVIRDVPPWGLAWGNRAALRGPNLVGMKRQGWTGAELRAARQVFRELFPPDEAAGGLPLAGRVTELERRFAGEGGGSPSSVVPDLLAFVRGPSVRGILGVTRPA